MKMLFFFQVTWIRHRDVHILTVGEYTYTTDQRFLARHNPNTDEWTLVIKYVQERDAGSYECQIPSRIARSYPVNLNIIGE
jgi:neurotrimin